MFDVFPMAPGPAAPSAAVIGGWPVTSWPGNRINPLTGKPGTHGNSVDLAHPSCFGEPFYATNAGLVVQSIDGSLTTRGGRWTRLQATNGNVIGYGHANRFAAIGGVSATNGGRRWVKAGDLLGYIGSTGGSTGAHMHLQTTTGDPVALLQEAAQAGRFPGAAPPITNVTPPTEDDMADLFQFPERDGGFTYQLRPEPTSITGYAWVAVSLAALADARDAGVSSGKVRPLAQGTDANDALFGRHPVMSGPHKRDTVSP